MPSSRSLQRRRQYEANNWLAAIVGGAWEFIGGAIMCLPQLSLGFAPGNGPVPFTLSRIAYDLGIDDWMANMFSPLCAFYQGYNTEQPGAVFLVIVFATLMLNLIYPLAATWMCRAHALSFALGMSNRFLNGTIDHLQARQALGTVLILMWLRMLNSFVDLYSSLSSVWMLSASVILLWGNPGESLGTMICQNIWAVIQGFGGMYTQSKRSQGVIGLSESFPDLDAFMIYLSLLSGTGLSFVFGALLGGLYFLKSGGWALQKVGFLFVWSLASFATIGRVSQLPPDPSKIANLLSFWALYLLLDLLEAVPVVGPLLTGTFRWYLALKTIVMILLASWYAPFGKEYVGFATRVLGGLFPRQATSTAGRQRR